MAEEKTIVLKIETITDQAVMEAYGKTLNSVLGSYEENTAMISEYTNTIKANQEAIKAIQKEGERWGQLTQKQAQRIANLNAENEKLKIAKSELVQITKNQIKVDNAEAGSMEYKSQLLGKLRMAWRKMTDEQKNANQGMLQTIQQLDASLKQADGSIGNFQRNVGDYKNAIGSFIGQFPALGGVVSKFAGPAGVITVATGAFNLLKSAMASTQTTGDALEIGIAAWQGTWDRFLRMIATADFTNFISQLTGAYDAAKELAEVRDEMFEKENSIRLLKAEQSIEEQKLLRILRDQTKSDQERIKAGRDYEDLVRKNAQIQADAYNKLAEEELDYIVAQTGANKEALRSYIKDYADPKSEAMRKEMKQYAEAVRLKELYEEQFINYAKAGAEKTADTYKAKAEEQQAIIDATSKGVKDFYEVTKAYGKAADNIIVPFVNAWEKALHAQSNATKEGNRAASMVSGLVKKATKDAETDAESGGEQVGDKVLEGMKKSFRKGDVSKDLTDAVERSVNVVLPLFYDTDLMEELKTQSKQLVKPMQKALGLTPEEKKQLEDQALQAAGQIFNSIAQLSKEATQRRLQDELDAIDKNAESEKAILEGKLEKGIISQKEYEKKLGEIDEQTAERKEQANKEAFEKQKRWNIAQALMNAALAITKLFTEGSAMNPATWVALGITAATTAAEIAVIASQKYARGGELRGASHAQGGIKGFVGNQHIEAEGGEVIINKRSSAKHRKLLSLINSDNGWGDDFAHARGSSGRFFARGGVIGGYDFRTSGVPDSSSSLSQIVRQQTDNLRQSFDAINRRIDNLRVSVLLSDIEAKSNEKRVHISRAVL